MLERGIKPDKFSISSVLKACGELRELGLGKEVHRHIGSTDLECDLFVYNALLAMYAKCRAVDNARKVFDELPERDIVSWNSMVLGYSSEGRWDETSEFLERMRLEGFELNSVTSNTIIRGRLLMGLKACSVIRYLTQGKEIHGLAIRSTLDVLENNSNALITLYSKCHNIGYARIVFQKSLA
ncbi:hypothetical protein IEQ34_008960 [Dendrobium chrysotoxum]|uniref:Pentatricopeptide repeat-containing protein n=1 Tax=Dendrobium chrysotoxum TaxID=161865 RepID=A0AAV7GHX0_DENCH|nr:hypothetical protein IEQ34_008960 [Dendrobium chrysotoxum]